MHRRTTSKTCLRLSFQRRWTDRNAAYAHQQKLRIAIEYVDRDSMRKPIAVNLRNNTVGEGLKTILRNGHGYSWRTRNGLIEIRNERGSKSADKQLDTVTPVFEIPSNESAKMASTMLWWNLQMKLDPTVKGFGGDILEGAETSTVTPATLHNRTVREILAYIVLNSRVKDGSLLGRASAWDSLLTVVCGSL
jgi:hypothetical protein